MSGKELRPRAHSPTLVSCSDFHESTNPRTHPGPLHPNTGSPHQETEKFLNFMEKTTMTISQKRPSKIPSHSSADSPSLRWL